MEFANQQQLLSKQAPFVVCLARIELLVGDLPQLAAQGNQHASCGHPGDGAASALLKCLHKPDLVLGMAAEVVLLPRTKSPCPRNRSPILAGVVPEDRQTRRCLVKHATSAPHALSNTAKSAWATKSWRVCGNRTTEPNVYVAVITLKTCSSSGVLSLTMSVKP